MRRFLFVFCLLTVSLSTTKVCAQAPKTPFEYPVAPDTCSTLESRCNFIVVNFWNNYDITRPIPDDGAFVQAFRDYVNFFKYAHRNIVMTSMRHFINKAQSNTPNLEKVGKVAELVLYSPYAEYWSDELYIEVARMLSEATKLKQRDRAYYKRQAELLSTNVVGKEIPGFDVVTADGKKKISAFEGETFLLFFTDDSSDSSMERIRLSTDVGVNALLSGGQVKIIQVHLGKPAAEWMGNQPEEWINGYSEQAAAVLDLRSMPCCFILDKDHKILTKNNTVDDIKAALN